ncbi:hypothetical protein C8F01DRAFT_1080570 [Mycena amicta]|nr:hypothetical protein C8F01DRAFT_1080570 [Mycena amicta]
MHSSQSLHNTRIRQLMSNALNIHLELLQLASTTPGEPSPFDPAFPRANAIIMLVDEQCLLSAQIADFDIHFRERAGTLSWWIDFDNTVMASFTIPATTQDSLRDWNPTAQLVLRALEASLWQNTAQPQLVLTYIFLQNVIINACLFRNGRNDRNDRNTDADSVSGDSGLKVLLHLAR